jgi:hypothetical protein
MTILYNVSIGSHDDHHMNGGKRYVKVWYDETQVARFQWHSVLTRDVLHHTHMIYGMSIEAGQVFTASKAFNSFPGKAIGPDGREVWCTWTIWNENAGDKAGIEEFHLGDRYGRVIARMTPTGYMQREEITRDQAKEAA